MVLVNQLLIWIQSEVEHGHHRHHKEGSEQHQKAGGEIPHGERGLDLTSGIFNGDLVSRDAVEVSSYQLI